MRQMMKRKPDTYIHTYEKAYVDLTAPLQVKTPSFKLYKCHKLALIFILQQADNFTNSLGILQQSATPTPFQGISTSNKSKSDTATGKNNTDAAEKNANNAVNGNAATTANSAVNGASQLQQQEGECAERFYYCKKSRDSKTVTCTCAVMRS